MAKAQRKTTAKCGCNVGYMVLSIILWTIGIYSLATGFISHFNYRVAGVVLLWYFIGIVLIALGKIAKWKAYECCNSHKM